jgi:SET domain-containing protein
MGPMLLLNTLMLLSAGQALALLPGLATDVCYGLLRWRGKQPQQQPQDEPAARFATWLQMRPSPGKGLGVFALRDLPKGTLIGRYTGVLRSAAEHDRLIERGLTSSEYTFELDEHWLIDAERGRGFARCVNHSVRRANVEAVGADLGDLIDSLRDEGVPLLPILLEGLRMIEVPTSPFAVYYETSRKITAGEELLINYGGQFWDSKLELSRLDPRRLAIDFA